MDTTLARERFGHDLDYVLGGVFSSKIALPSGREYSGILEAADQQMMSADGDIAGLSTTFLLTTTAAAQVAIESRVTVDGAPYIVRDRRRADDGALTRLYLVDV